MKKRNGISVKEIILMGIFATIIMDIGYVFLVVTNIVQGSNEPQFLGRWILHMFDGEFIQENIRAAQEMKFEKPVSLLVHYLTGIFLSGVFLKLSRIRNFPRSIYMGLIFGWITLLFPWFLFYPFIGFGIMGLDTPEGINNIFYSIIYHSFFGLGITFWLGFVGKFFIKDKDIKSVNG